MRTTIGINGLCSTAKLTFLLPLCTGSLPIQLYLVDSFFYAASATSAAAVSLLVSSFSIPFLVMINHSFFDRSSGLLSHYLVNQCSTNLGWEVEIPYVFFCPALFHLLKRLGGGGDLKKQLLAGIAIVIGIPFPIWIYYKGEELRARNPLTKMSTIPKRIVSES